MTIGSFPTVSIILLNWNGWKDTLECLESIFSMDYTQFAVVVVDNGSSDDSVNQIITWVLQNNLIEIFKNGENSEFIFKRGSEPLGIRFFQTCLKFNSSENQRYLYLVQSESNLGFAEGYNVGLYYAIHYLRFDYVIILNNDTIVDRNFLSALVDTVKNDSEVVIVGPKSYNYKDPSRLGCSGGTIGKWMVNIKHLYAGETEKGQFNKIEKRDFVSGTCMLFSTKALREYGLLNPNFFFGGGEDIDISLRFTKHGLKILSTPKAVLWHKGEAITAYNLDDNRLNLYGYYSVRNMILLLILHYKGLHFISALFLLPFQLIWMLLSFLRSKRNPKILINPIKGFLHIKQ